jgi:hypothetical protein
LNNLTVSVGREAVFTCIVEDLGPYKVRVSQHPEIPFPRAVAAAARRIRRCNCASSRPANPACAFGGDFDKRAREYSANTIRRDELADDTIARRIFR